jgi:hypothetical protein
VNTTRLVLALTGLNLVLLLGNLMMGPRAVAQDALPVLRGRALEIVDTRGQTRARISIEPETTVDGKTYPEAAVLRLTGANGRIRVKLGADDQGSGLLLANDQQAPGIHLLATRDGASLKLASPDGREQVLRP